jgi:hypothetical protein
VCKLSLSLAQCLFGALAVGDIDYGTHKFNELAGWAQDWMGDRVDISDLTARINDSVIRLELSFFTLCRLDYFSEPCFVFRVDALNKGVESWQFTVRIKSQHAATLFG